MPFKSASLTNPRLQHPDEISKDPWNNSNQEVYQTVQFNNIQLPELSSWNAGDEYEIVLKVKLEKRIDSSQNEVVGEFKILEVKAEENPGEEMMTDEQKHYKELIG